jgi:hypothetical protein
MEHQCKQEGGPGGQDEMAEADRDPDSGGGPDRGRRRESHNFFLAVPGWTNPAVFPQDIRPRRPQAAEAHRRQPQWPQEIDSVGAPGASGRGSVTVNWKPQSRHCRVTVIVSSPRSQPER